MDIQAIFNSKLSYIEAKINSLGTSTSDTTVDFSSILSDKINSLADSNSNSNDDVTSTDTSSQQNNKTQASNTIAQLASNSLYSTALGSQSNDASSVTATSPSTAYDSIINSASKKYGVDSDLIKAVIKQESDFDPNEVSSAGASGLMQLMPDTASSLGVSNVNDPAQNVDGGTKYLKSLLDNFKDVKLALAAYNAGPNSVKKYNDVPPYSETKDYVNKVISNYNAYKQH